MRLIAIMKKNKMKEKEKKENKMWQHIHKVKTQILKQINYNIYA